MRKSLKHVLLPVVGAVCVLIFIAIVVSAQTSESGQVANGFRISPVRSEFTIEKGRSETLTITIENPTDVPTVAQPIVNDFVASDKENGEPRLILDETAERPQNSIKILVSTIPDIPLNGGERKNITVTLRVPDDANAGGYYGAIRFVPSTLDEEGNVGLAASVGTIVLVRVPGDLVEQLDLVQLSAGQNGSPKGFLMSGNVQVITRLKNEGDIHVQPFGKIEVRSMLGKTVAQYELNDSEPRANVLPGSVRKFVEDLESKRWLGRYTVVANLGYSQGSGELITAQAAFWYLPVWAIAILVILLGALMFVVYRLYKRFTSRRFRKSPR